MVEVNEDLEVSFLKIKSDEKCYFLNAQCPKKGNFYLSLAVLDGSQVWTGKVSHEILKDQARSAEKGFSDFLCETKTAFALSHIRSLGEFCLGIEIEENCAVVSWKKVLDQDLKFQLGTAKLHRDEGISMNSFLGVAVGQFMKMKDEVNDLSSTKEKLLREREKALKRLDGFVQAKNEIEKSLYEKFALVLNAKKAKIRELKQKCKEMEDSTKSLEMNSKDASPSKVSEGNNYDDTTDEESDQGNEKEDKCMPILLADVELEECMPPAAKRKLRNQQRKDKTPQMPRKISLPRADTKESLSLKRKSSRQASSLSSPSDDVNKLINMI